mmetsp:Transcript_14193/g.28638  ORF Transcript_14193/g.28638 Transcript_14193/m.28638 type:complete len:200 (+) Transcript_14193:192-791(+)
MSSPLLLNNAAAIIIITGGDFPVAERTFKEALRSLNCFSPCHCKGSHLLTDAERNQLAKLNITRKISRSQPIFLNDDESSLDHSFEHFSAAILFNMSLMHQLVGANATALELLSIGWKLLDDIPVASATHLGGTSLSLRTPLIKRAILQNILDVLPSIGREHENPSYVYSIFYSLCRELFLLETSILTNDQDVSVASAA